MTLTPLEIRCLQMRRGHLLKQRRLAEANAILKRLQRNIRQELARK